MFNTEMTCSAYCVIAVGFIFATIATCCLSSKNFQDFNWKDVLHLFDCAKNVSEFEHLVLNSILNPKLLSEEEKHPLRGADIIRRTSNVATFVRPMPLPKRILLLN